MKLQKKRLKSKDVRTYTFHIDGMHCPNCVNKARKIFNINSGDNLIVLGDEGQGIAIIKERE